MDDMVTVTMTREQAEDLAGAVGDYAYITHVLGDTLEAALAGEG